MNKRKHSTHFRWTVVGLLFFITVFNYIDRASLSYAIDIIGYEFQLSQQQIGFILGAFGIGYMLTTLLGGIAADRYGAHKTLTVAALLWSIATALTGFTHSFFIMVVARVALGIAEGPNFPCLTRAISDWLPENERNRALSASLVAVPLALAFGGLISTQLIIWLSWRGMYFTLTAITCLWIPIWWYYFCDNPKNSNSVDSKELAHIHQTPYIASKITKKTNSWRSLVLNKTLVSNNWAFFVFGFYLFFFMTWLPNYLSQTYHFKLMTIGLYTMLPWLTAALFIWGLGTLSDWIFQKTKNLRWSRSYPIILSQLLSGLCLIPITWITTPAASITFISLAVGFAMSANAPFYAVNIDIAKERAGTALGMMDTVFALSGFVAPTVTGIMVSWSGHFSGVFWLLSLLALSSVCVTLLWHNRA